jgi:hypothetical protein
VVSVVLATGTLGIAGLTLLVLLKPWPTAPSTQTEHSDASSSKLAADRPAPETAPTSRQAAPLLAASSIPQLQDSTAESSRPVGKIRSPRTGPPNPAAAPTPTVSVPLQNQNSPMGARRPTATATSSPAPTPPPRPAAAQPDCDPNYTIDPKSGAHLFKPECFSK